MRKKNLVATSLVVVTLLVFAVTVANAQTREGWPKATSIGVPSVGSSPYMVYAGLGEMMRKYLNVTGTAEAVGGSTTIAALMGKKKIQFAQVSTDVLYEAPRGIGAYKGKKLELRQISPGITFAMFFFARADSGIKKPEDIRGKRFVVYSPTSAAITLMGDLLLKSMGMTRKDLVAMPSISQPDAVRSVTDHSAEGFIHAGSPLSPVSNFAEMANSIEVKLIPITKEQQKFIVAQSKGVLIPSEIKGGNYKGNPDPVRSVAYDCPFITLPEMPEDLVYEITKLMYGKEHRNEFVALHPAAQTFVVARLEQDPPLVPYHKGAIKFYKTLGVWTKKMEEYQKNLLKELGVKE
jgi:uncharacterized protein